MELHDHLYSLGLQLGRGVFDDADGFRGALDDFLDEGAASTGDINLLVDAVRLGAFRSMTTMLDSGADAPRAIEDAGTRLARDRGSSDLASAQWALAVLGFAIGKVSDADVRRYRSMQAGPQRPAGGAVPPPQSTRLPSTPPAPPTPPTGLPPTGLPQTGLPPTGLPPGSAQAPPTQVGTPQPHVSPVGSNYPGQPPAAPYAPQHQSGGAGFGGPAGVPPGPGSIPGAGSWGAAPQQPKKKVWPILAAVVAVLAVIGGGITAFVISQNGDDDPKKASKTSDSGPTTETTTPVSYAFEDINDRYAGLGGNITTGLNVDSCQPSTSMAGQAEHLECTFASGTLTLITWNAKSDLNAERKRQIDYRPGGILLDNAAGKLFGFEESTGTGDDRVVTKAYLYWDSASALQSARYDHATDAGTPELDTLVNLFNSTSPTVSYPTKPSNPDLIGFAQQWLDTNTCARIQTVYTGEKEESKCTPPGEVTIYIGKFRNGQEMRRHRRQALGYAKADNRRLRTWNQQEGDPPVGALYEYETDSGTIVRYWDQPSCSCYMEAYLPNGTYEDLYDWWRNQ